MAVTWTAPPECPDEGAVRANVAQLLAGSPATGEARAVVNPRGDGWQVVVSMNGGERRLEASSCRALADAAALIIAMGVDPARVVANRGARDAGHVEVDAAAPLPPPAPLDAGTPPSIDAAPFDAAPAPAPVTSPPPAPAREPTHPAPEPPASPPVPRFVAVSVAGALDVGALPSPAGGASLGVAWAPWPLRLELSGAYFPSSTAAVGTPSGVFAPHVQFSLLAAAFRACYGAELGRFELGPCGGIEGGLLLANPQGFSAIAGAAGSPISSSSPLLAFEAGAFAAWRFLPDWAIFLHGGALFQTLRPAFQVSADQASTNTVFQPGPATGRASAGVELRF